MDSNNLGLNQYLQPENSPITQNQNISNTFTFDYQNERNAVSATKIASLTADKIRTGLLTAVATLGGGTSTAYVQIDGVNNRIIVNDGTVNRIILGYQSNGF